MYLLGKAMVPSSCSNACSSPLCDLGLRGMK